MTPSSSTPMRGASRPRIAPSIAALIEGATHRRSVSVPDGKSGSTFERLQIDGKDYFLKSLSYEDDWIMRITHDREHRPFTIWRAGLYDRVPACIDHTVEAMALEGSGTSARLAMLMRDVGDELIPEGDDVVPLDVHIGLLTDMAALHAHNWGWRDTIGLVPLTHRFRFFAPDNIASELARPDVSVVLTVAERGWELLRERSPALADVATRVHAQPGPLADALARTPNTFVPGDWKMGNLGRHDDGRTIVLDWAYPGEAPGTWELAWYLALNRARLPQSKEDSIAVYREALQGCGIEVSPWFERQMSLSLLAIVACFAWEKAHGDDDELGWWEHQALAGVALLETA